jgi:hypothetical protein
MQGFKWPQPTCDIGGFWTLLRYAGCSIGQSRRVTSAASGHFFLMQGVHGPSRRVTMVRPFLAGSAIN